MFQTPIFSWAELNSDLDWPKWTKVRLQAADHNFKWLGGVKSSCGGGGGAEKLHGTLPPPPPLLLQAENNHIDHNDKSVLWRNICFCTVGFSINLTDHVLCFCSFETTICFNARTPQAVTLPHTLSQLTPQFMFKLVFTCYRQITADSRRKFIDLVQLAWPLMSNWPEIGLGHRGLILIKK